jgi:hypothetical protein
MSGNDIVCFLLKGAENLPARGRKTEKNITLALWLFLVVVVCVGFWCFFFWNQSYSTGVIFLQSTMKKITPRP